MADKSVKKNPHEPMPGNEVEYVHAQSRHDASYSDGRQMVSPLPIAPPVGYKKHPTIAEQIRTMVRSERLAQEAAAAGFETFDEADDFEVGDDYDPTSPYEVNFDPAPEAPAPAAAPAEPGQEAPKHPSEPTPPSSTPGAGGSTS